MSNRNFDSRTIIHRLQQLNIAQNFYKTQKNGQQIINNPQNTDSTSQQVTNYLAGRQTTYTKNLGTGYTISTGGIANNIS